MKFSAPERSSGVWLTETGQTQAERFCLKHGGRTGREFALNANSGHGLSGIGLIHQWLSANIFCPSISNGDERVSKSVFERVSVHVVNKTFFFIEKKNRSRIADNVHGMARTGE